MWSRECVVGGATLSQQSCNMSPRNVCRSFVISVAITFILDSPTSGFSIQRTSEISVDLIAEESTILEVKDNLKRPNDIKTSIKTDESQHKLIAKENVRDKFEVSTFPVSEKANFSIENAVKIKQGLNEKEGKFTTIENVNETDKESTLEFFTTSTLDTESETSNITKESIENNDLLSETAPNTKFNTDPSSQQTSILVFEDFTKMTSYDTTPNTVIQTNTLPSKITFTKSSMSLKNILLNTENESHRKNTQTPELQVTSTPIESHSNKIYNSKIKLFFDNKPENSQLNIYNVKLSKHFTNSTGKPSSLGTENKSSISNEEVSIGTVINTSLDATDQNTHEISTILESTLHVDEIPSTVQVDITNSEATLTANTNPTTTVNTSPTDTDYQSRNDISRKKYTVIDRKHTTTTDNNTPTTYFDTEMAKAETSQTRYVYDKAFSFTSLNPLEKLSHNQITSSPIHVPVENDFSINPLLSPGLITHPRIGTVSSLRAGFLDYSGKSSTPSTTIDKADKETFGIMYESIDLGDSDRLENKNISGVESQNQLAEDVIKEELLKEEMMNDQVEYTKQSRDDRADNQDIKPFDLDMSSVTQKQPPTLSQEETTENALNVQPISQEQGKNMDLYVVSPNYKPMKRIEVQPAKPFVRDPDDNSWRNMSISSLGIVFKPKNSSKSFTQVLKNKTETELNSFTDRDSKAGLPDLRERLEKIAEVRKSKKKRVNKNGDTIYSDYEENNSGESITTEKVGTTTISSTKALTDSTTMTSLASSSAKPETTISITTEKTTTGSKQNIFKIDGHDALTTSKPPKNFYNAVEYYDTTDEYDADYMALSKIDIKKSTDKPTETTVTAPTLSLTKPLRLPERKPTIEYFPPRVTARIYDYDNDFQRKINFYVINDNTKPTGGRFYKPTPTIATYDEKTKEEFDKTVKPIEFPLNRQELINLNKNLYLTEMPQVTTTHDGSDVNDESFNKASYVIKHYRNYLNVAAKDDDDKVVDYVTLADLPLRDTTLDELAKMRTSKEKSTMDNDYQYQIHHPKNVINKFVDNFNQNSERYKVDFPIFFNNSAVKKYQDKGVFMKRLYGNADTATKSNFFVKSCDPNCDSVKVELSPAYELHYYVPEQEEKEEIEFRPATAPYHYRL